MNEDTQQDYQEDIAVLCEHCYDVEGDSIYLEFDVEYSYGL